MKKISVLLFVFVTFICSSVLAMKTMENKIVDALGGYDTYDLLPTLENFENITVRELKTWDELMISIVVSLNTNPQLMGKHPVVVGKDFFGRKFIAFKWIDTKTNTVHVQVLFQVGENWLTPNSTNSFWNLGSRNYFKSGSPLRIRPINILSNGGNPDVVTGEDVNFVNECSKYVLCRDRWTVITDQEVGNLSRLMQGEVLTFEENFPVEESDKMISEVINAKILQPEEQAELENFVVNNSNHTSVKRGERIGPRTIPNWTLQDVDGGGNCFFYACVDQLTRFYSEFLKRQLTSKKKELKLDQGIAPHQLLRHIAQGSNYGDGIWADHPEIVNLARRLNVIIAVADTRHPSLGFLYYYVDHVGNTDYTNDIGMIYNAVGLRPVIRLAYTGNHYLSVVSTSSNSHGGIISMLWNSCNIL